MARYLCAAAVAVLLVLFGYSWQRTSGRSLSALKDKPVPSAVSSFLAPEDLKGEAFVLISDMYDEECNQRSSELMELITKLAQEGSRARMLHAGRHGFPVTSYADARRSNRGAPTTKIVADSLVLYENEPIRFASKPALLILRDGMVVDAKSGEQFDEWFEQF